MQPMPNESAEVRTVEVTLDTVVRGLNKRIGPPIQPLDGSMTEKQNDARRAELLRGGFENASEVYEHRAAHLDLQRLQMQRELADGKQVDMRMLTATAQAQAYHEYLPLLLQSLKQSMQKYQEHRKIVPPSVLRSPEVARSEVAAQLMLSMLDDVLAERIAFANAESLSRALRRGAKPEGGEFKDAAERQKYEQQLVTAFADRALTGRSVAALTQNTELAEAEYANVLNQRVLDLLSGATLAEQHSIIGFVPQAMSLELLTAAYEQTLAEEKATVIDSDASKAGERIRALEAEAAANGNTLPEAKKEEYDRLSARQSDRKKHLAGLERQRAMLLDELLKHSGDLGVFQVRAEQLTAIQRQFQRPSIDAERPSNPQKSPQVVTDEIAKNMQTRKTFHLDRLESFLGTLEKEDGLMELTAGKRLEEFNNSTMRPLALKVVQTLADIASMPLPDQYGMKKRFREAIAGDLERAMGIPLDERGRPKPEKDWTPDERANVEKKARSVMDAIDEFRYKNSDDDNDGKITFETDAEGNRIEKGHTKNLRATITAIRLLPPAHTFVNQPIGKLPKERVTPENMKAFIADREVGGAAVYAKLMVQLLEDWNTVDSETGEMMKKIDDVVGMHIKVGEAEIQLADDIWWVVKMLVYGLAALGVLQALGWVNRIRKMIFGDGKATKGDVKNLDKKKVDKTEFEEFKRQVAQDIEDKMRTDKANSDVESLIEPDGDGSPIADSSATTPPIADAADISKTAVDARSAAESDGKADSSGSRPRRPGGRK